MEAPIQLQHAASPKLWLISPQLDTVSWMLITGSHTAPFSTTSSRTFMEFLTWAIWTKGARWDLGKKLCSLYLETLDHRCFIIYASLVSFLLLLTCNLLNLLASLVQDVNDVLSAVDHAIEMGLADPSRITVLGGSHGGFLATHLIGQVM